MTRCVHGYPGELGPAQGLVVFVTGICLGCLAGTFLRIASADARLVGASDQLPDRQTFNTCIAMGEKLSDGLDECVRILQQVREADEFGGPMCGWAGDDFATFHHNGVLQ